MIEKYNFNQSKIKNRKIINKKTVILIAVILFNSVIFLNPLTAQLTDDVVDWDVTFGGSRYDKAMWIEQTLDGGYIVGGMTDSYGPSAPWWGSFWLIKLNSDGTKNWDCTYGGGNWDGAWCVNQTSDGGYILCGLTHSFCKGIRDMWIVKTDSNGILEWSKNYGDIGLENGLEIKETSYGYIIIGQQNHVEWDDDNYDVWLVAIDFNGDMLWEKNFGGPGFDSGWSIQILDDNGYIILGWKSSIGFENRDFWLIRTDSEGALQWDKTFGGPDEDQGISIDKTVDGGFILGGYTKSYGTGGSDFWVIKTDSNGNIIWNKTWGGSDEDVCQTVRQTSDGGFLISGFTYSFGAGGQDLWLIKTDQDGNEQWQKTFGGADDDSCWGAHAEETFDKGYVLCGATRSFSQGLDDAWIIKIKNLPPTADAGGPYNGIEGSQVIFNSSNTFDPSGDQLYYRWDFDNNGIWDTDYLTEPTITYTYFDDYIGQVNLQVTDGISTVIDTADIIIGNTNPIIDDVIIEKITESDMRMMRAVLVLPDDYNSQTTVEIYENNIKIGEIYDDNLPFDFIHDKNKQYVVKFIVDLGQNNLVLKLDFSLLINGVPSDNAKISIMEKFNKKYGLHQEREVDVTDELNSLNIPLGQTNYMYSFTASLTDIGSDDLIVVWDFGDGLSATANYYNEGTHPFIICDQQTHQYNVKGSYIINLTVSDDDGGFCNYEVTLLIT